MAPNQFAGTIIDLIRQGGADQAAALQRNGQIRGQMASDLGQMAQGTIGAILKERAEAPIRQADAAYRDAQVKHLAAEDADTVAKRKTDEDAKQTAAKVQRVHNWLGSLASIEDPKEREAVYQQGAQAFKADGTMPAENLPSTFPGLGWVKARFVEGLPVVEQFKHLFPEQKAPEPFTLGPGQTRFDANGSPIADVPATPARPAGPVNLTPGSVLVDPATGKVIAKGNPQREPQGPQPGYQWVIRNGQRQYVIPRPGDEPASTERPATQTQFTAGTYAGRMEQSEDVLSQLENNIASMNPVSFWAQSKSPTPAMQSGNFQSFDQAARNFINAVLRRESGAAISESEFDNARKQYLPQPGDTETTLAQKKANRDYVFASFKREAGGAYSPPAKPPEGGAPVANGTRRIVNGHLAEWDGKGWLKVGP